MASQSPSPILSAITGGVLLLHVLCLVALMLQENPFEALASPGGIQVRVSDIRQEPIETIAPRIIPEDVTALIPPAPAPDQTPPDLTALAINIPDPEPLNASEAAAIVSPSVMSSTSAASPIPAEPRPSNLSTQAVAKTVVPTPRKEITESPKKPNQKKIISSSKPAPKRSTAVAKATNTPEKERKTASQKLKNSSEAQAALKRLRGQESAVSASPARASSGSSVSIKPLESDAQGRGGNQNQQALDRLMAALQGCVVLPERGEVRMKLEISPQGRIVNLSVLQSGSSRNRSAIEKALRSLHLPVEGLVRGSSLTVVVTFKHA